MNYTYQFSNRNGVTYIQEFQDHKKVDGRFLSLHNIINDDIHRDYKALKNRIKNWLIRNHPELLI